MIFILNNLFDGNDSQDIKNILSEVIETMDLSDGFEIPSDYELVTDAPKENVYNFNTPKQDTSRISQDLEKMSETAKKM